MRSVRAEGRNPFDRLSGSTVDLIGLDRAGMVSLLESIGEKRFRARQLLKWVHQRRIHDFQAMTDLAKPLRVRLSELCRVDLPRVEAEEVSADGTTKWLLRLADGNAVETVFIPEAKRGTLCVSSQAGCAMGCTFCATAAATTAAAARVVRNLSTAEIAGQLHTAVQRLPEGAVTNIVFMGMGEPLLNLNAVVAASRIFTDDDAFGLSKRRVTISTSGVAPALERLRGLTDVSLAVSLHAPDNALRDRLIPLNRKYPLERLLPACDAYIRDKHPRRITWEYVMLDGVNDADEQARRLAKLLRNIPSKVNLIPFNPFPGAAFRCSPESRIRRFADILAERGLTTTVRSSRGGDIGGACGQLVGRLQGEGGKGRCGERDRGGIAAG